MMTMTTTMRMMMDVEDGGDADDEEQLTGRTLWTRAFSCRGTNQNMRRCPLQRQTPSASFSHQGFERPQACVRTMSPRLLARLLGPWHRRARRRRVVARRIFRGLAVPASRTVALEQFFFRRGGCPPMAGVCGCGWSNLQSRLLATNVALRPVWLTADALGNGKAGKLRHQQTLRPPLVAPSLQAKGQPQGKWAEAASPLPSGEAGCSKGHSKSRSASVPLAMPATPTDAGASKVVFALGPKGWKREM